MEWPEAPINSPTANYHISSRWINHRQNRNRNQLKFTGTPLHAAPLASQKWLDNLLPVWSTRFDRWDSIHFDYRRRWWAAEKRQPGRAAGLGLMADMADCSAACHHRRCRLSSKTIFPRINLRANPNQRINIRGGGGNGKRNRKWTDNVVSECHCWDHTSVVKHRRHGVLLLLLLLWLFFGFEIPVSFNNFRLESEPEMEESVCWEDQLVQARAG